MLQYATICYDMLQVLEDLLLLEVEDGKVSKRDLEMLKQMNLAWYKACQNMLFSFWSNLTVVFLFLCRFSKMVFQGTAGFSRQISPSIPFCVIQGHGARTA